MTWEINYENGGRVGGFETRADAERYLYDGDEPGSVDRTDMPDKNDAAGWDRYRNESGYAGGGK